MTKGTSALLRQNEARLPHVLAVVAVLVWSSPALLHAQPVAETVAYPPLSARSLVVGGDANFPPYEFLDADGEPSGFDVELFEAVAEVLDLQVEVRLGPWDEVREMLEAGQIDAVVGMHYSVERDELLDFSTPYAMAHYAVFVREDREDIRGVADLGGRRVVVQAGALVQDMGDQLGITHTMVTVPGPEQALRGLAAGDYDAALLFQHQGLYLAERLGLEGIVVVGRPMAPKEYCFAVLDGDEQLVRALNEGLAVVKATGRYQELQTRWLGVLEPKRWSWQRSLVVLAWVLVPAAIVVLLALLQAWFLQRRVRERTRELLDQLAERRRAEAALAQERERLLVTLRSIGDAVLTTDRDGRVEMMNRVAESLLDQSLVEARGLRIQDVLPLVATEHGQPLPDILHRVLGGEVDRLVVHAARLAVGSEPLVSLVAAPILDLELQRQGVVVALRDITAQHRMEQELARADKLQTVGVLAGGIAHDFNNLLTGVMGNLSLASERLDPDHPVQRHLERAEAATERAQGLTQQLLTFSKGGVPVRRVLALEPLVRDAVEFALAGGSVRCTLQIALDLWPLEADPGQLSQVLHNLLLNAAQSMPEGGQVTVQAENLTLIEGGQPGLAPGPYLQLRVRDEGPGIPAALAESIFEPFFTTKSQGSGLGLATAYSISLQHGGWLGLEPADGAGACFRWLLPAQPGAELSHRLPERVAQPGEGRVLVMDDEEVVREVLEAMLSTMGYRVTLVVDGEAAVESYRRALGSDEPFRAVIMDLTVPGGMGGVEAMAAILALDPRACGVVSSGFSDDPVMADPGSYGFRGVVAKPYRLAELSGALADAMLPVQA